MLELILFALAFLLGGFGVELLLLRLTREKWKGLRLLPLLAVAGLCVYAWNVFRTPSMFGGLGDLEGVAALIAAVLVLLGWGLAQLAAYISGKKTAMRKNN